jgi:hypothetical protein
MNFNFGEVLTRAWKIIWKHKVLWIFGILASCGRGGGGNSGNSSRYSSGGPTPNLPPQVMQWFQWIQSHLTQFIAITVTVFCVIWIIVAFLSTIGKIGLIRGTAQAEGGAESLLFGQLFSESMPYFWRMFGLSLILALPVLVLVIVLAAGALALIIPISQNSGNGPAMGALAILPIMLGCFCLLIPIMFVLNMVFGQAQRAIVLEELGVMPAISRGWDVFRNNLGPIILMAIILTVIAFIIGLVIAIPILVIVVPAAFAFAVGNAKNTTPLILAGVCFCLYLPVLWLLSGILTAYTESAWTLTYIQLTRKPESGNSSAAPLDVGPVKPPEDDEKTIIAAKPNA